MRIACFVSLQRRWKVECECVFPVLSQGGEPHGVPGGYSAPRWGLEDRKVRIASRLSEPVIGEIGVERHGPGQVHHIDRTAGHRIHRLGALTEAAGQHERYLGYAPRMAGELQEIGAAVGHTIRACLGAGEVGSAADVNQVDRGLIEQTHHLKGIGLCQPTFQFVRGIDPDPDGECGANSTA